MEGMLIKGVAKGHRCCRYHDSPHVPDEPGMSFRIFGLLAQKNINVDIILQTTGRDGKKDMSFTCAEGEAELAMRVLKESAALGTDRAGIQEMPAVKGGFLLADDLSLSFEDISFVNAHVR